MATTRFLGSLRNVLFTDALTCVACGVLMLLGANPLGALMQIPASLLFYAGLSLLPIAGLMAFTGARATHVPSLVWLIIAGNVLWVAASLWLMTTELVAPNNLGMAFIGLQAAVVGVITVLEIRATSSGRVDYAVA